MLKRKITDELLNWKRNKNKECLLVKGARQVGKTYIIDKFGKTYYKSYVYINFYEEPKFKNIFEGSLKASDIYKKMSLYVEGLNLIKNNTLIFLDEIQECPNARTALKFLAIDNKYDVIASGSLLGIGYKSIASVPVGYEKQITMFPLDFEEFLWALGVNGTAIDYIKTFFEKKEKVEYGINEEMFNMLREYIVVGGMPEVVNSFIKNKNYSTVFDIQSNILATYYDDIIKYAEALEKPKIRTCFNSISKQLAKENKKFQYSVVEKGCTSRKYASSVQWLIDANLVIPIYNVSTPILPLEAYAKDNYFKIYLFDIGLLTAMYGFDIKQSILNNTLVGGVKGGIYENLICNMLIARKYKPYYFKVENNSQEIEFLITKNGEIIPVEVKAGNTSSVSLNNFIAEYKPSFGYKLITGNIGVSDDHKVTLPLYMTMFL